MLGDKYSGRIKFLKNTPTIKKIYEKNEVDGVILTLSGRIVRNADEELKTADFEFLMVDDSFTPWNTTVVFEEKKWKTDKKNLEEELGKMEEEGKIAKATKWLPDSEIFEKIYSEKRVKKILRKSKYMRLVNVEFTLFDEEKERPVWKLFISNTPHVWAIQKKEGVEDDKMEDSKSAEIIADALTGALLGCREY